MIDPISLAALSAVIRHGSFERAASRLNVSASAVSQRVRQLEERLGATLVVRGKPCRPTPVGSRLCRHADEVGLLERTLREELALAWPESAPPVLRIAVNADSLATWFVEAITGVPDRLFELVLDDEKTCSDWLARGEVVAAVSARAEAPPGCRSTPLGALRYLATASPAFRERHFAAGVTHAALAGAPQLAFDAADDLQFRWTRRHLGGETVSAPTHRLPSSESFVTATLAGIGWSMNPETLARPLLASGRLVELVAETPLDVTLHWQTTRLMHDALGDVERAVRRSAGANLHPVTPGGAPSGESPPDD